MRALALTSTEVDGFGALGSAQGTRGPVDRADGALPCEGESGCSALLVPLQSAHATTQDVILNELGM